MNIHNICKVVLQFFICLAINSSSIRVVSKRMETLQAYRIFSGDLGFDVTSMEKKQSVLRSDK